MGLRNRSRKQGSRRDRNSVSVSEKQIVKDITNAIAKEFPHLSKDKVERVVKHCLEILRGTIRKDD